MVGDVVDPWQDEAEKKGFPKPFIEQLEASDSVTEEEKRKIVESMSTVAAVEEELQEMSLRDREILNEDPGVLRTVGKTREEWIDQGRRLGEHEAEIRREKGDEAAERVKRAMAYAAWEWDGKPQGYGDRYRVEFGMKEIRLMPSFDRPPSDQSS